MAMDEFQSRVNKRESSYPAIHYLISVLLPLMKLMNHLPIWQDSSRVHFLGSKQRRRNQKRQHGTSWLLTMQTT